MIVPFNMWCNVCGSCLHCRTGSALVGGMTLLHFLWAAKQLQTAASSQPALFCQLSFFFVHAWPLSPTPSSGTVSIYPDLFFWIGAGSSMIPSPRLRWRWDKAMRPAYPVSLLLLNPTWKTCTSACIFSYTWGAPAGNHHALQIFMGFFQRQVMSWLRAKVR